MSVRVIGMASFVLLGSCIMVAGDCPHCAGGVLAVDYTLVDDFCDCACMLDVSYDLVDVPAGTWTIVAGTSGATASVTVQ